MQETYLRIRENQSILKISMDKEMLMKQKMFCMLPIGILVLSLIVSCAGAPKPTPPEEGPSVEQPAEQPSVVEEKPDLTKLPPDQETEAALNQAKARAEKSRKQAFDIDGPKYFAEDWKAAEALYGAAQKGASQKTMASYTEAIKNYNASADAYDGIANRSLPLYAQERRSEIEVARSQAIKAGAAELLPDQLAVADEVANSAQEQYEAADYYTAAASAQEALNRYITLKTGLDAYAVKSEIDDKNFAPYDPGNYSIADQKLDSALNNYDAGNIKAAQDAAEEALLRFRLALKKGKEMYATSRQNSATTAQKEALTLKAQVAVKAEYDAANEIYQKANAAFKVEQYDEAAQLYEQAEQQFVQVRDIAAAKRKKAEDAMQQAEQQITVSQKTAKEAEAILQGGAR